MYNPDSYTHKPTSQKYYDCACCGEQIYYAFFVKHLEKKHNMTAQEYYHKYMSPGTTPHVCPECSKPIKFFQFNKPYTEYCSVKCRSSASREEFGAKAKERWKDPSYRIKISEMSRELGKARWDSVSEEVKSKFQEQRNQNISAYFKNYEFMKEVYIKGGKSWKGKKFSEQHKANLRISGIKASKKYRLANKDLEKHNATHYKKGWHYSEKVEGGRIYFDSSYELQAFKLLDQLCVVKSYEKEPVCLEYTFEEVTRNYWPDLLITYTDGQKQLVEVKPSVQLKWPVNIAKFESAEKYCLENGLNKFVIWTEKEIFDTGVLQK